MSSWNARISSSMAPSAAAARRHGGKVRLIAPVSGRRCFLGGLVAFAAFICVARLSLLLMATTSGSRSKGDQITLAGGDHTVGNEFRSELSFDPGDTMSGKPGEILRPHSSRIRAFHPGDKMSRYPGEISSRIAVQDDDGPYHSRRVFLADYQEMLKKFKVFIYPCSKNDPFKHIFLPDDSEPGGNYASESYFKKALANSNMVTTDPSEADLFYMPFSITGLRHDRRIGVKGIKDFIKDYVKNIRDRWPYWNRTDGSDHFYVACHSIGKSALDHAEHVKLNAIQVVCSSNYFVQGYIPHKDITIPQIWPRHGDPPGLATLKQRKTLGFFAGGANSPIRAKLVKVWGNDSQIHVYSSRISAPYSKALLGSKFCLHVKGYEVNTARLGDAFFYGCVPVVISNHYDLPFNSVLNWERFSVIVSTDDIPKLKSILSGISPEEYKRMQKFVVDLRKHFKWHSPPKEYDAFYMVMYQLWLRRRIVRFSLQ